MSSKKLLADDFHVTRAPCAPDCHLDKQAGRRRLVFTNDSFLHEFTLLQHQPAWQRKKGRSGFFFLSLSLSLLMLKRVLSSNLGHRSQFRAGILLPAWLSDLVSELQSPVLLALMPDNQGTSHNRLFWGPIPIIYLFMNLSILSRYWSRFSGERWLAHILNGTFLSWLS